MALRHGLWADSICINQKDVEEKTRQVNMMGEIYSLADTIFLWLGLGSESTDAAMNFISHFSPRAIETGVTNWRTASLGVYLYDIFHDLPSTILSLAKRPWEKV